MPAGLMWGPRVLLSAAVLLPGLPTTSAPPPVMVGREVEGTLAAGDERTESGALADTYVMESAVRQTVTVVVQSWEADTRVSVLDGSGQVLGTDDQGGIGG